MAILESGIFEKEIPNHAVGHFEKVIKDEDRFFKIFC